MEVRGAVPIRRVRERRLRSLSQEADRKRKKAPPVKSGLKRAAGSPSAEVELLERDDDGDGDAEEEEESDDAS